MSVGISKPVKHQHIPEHWLWASGPPRRACAWCRWAELRIYYCGGLLRSEVVRDGRNVGDVAEPRKWNGASAA